MARHKVTPEVVVLPAYVEETPVVEAVEPAPVVTINMDPIPDEEPPLSAQTRAEMEAGRRALAQFSGE